MPMTAAPLLRQPTVSQEHVAFLHASDIWIANRDGSAPRRLTVHRGIKSAPMFSPDGRWIAFSGNYDGNMSVHVIPPEGGSPQRVTYHPGASLVRGWTPDSQRVLFASSRETPSARYHRLYTVGLDGAFPEPLPMPMAERGAYSPDGSRIAYTPVADAFWSWKRYRGGQVGRIWVLDLASHDYIQVPHEDANDSFPCWDGNAIYFVSDRANTMNLFRYGLESGTMTQLTHHADWDLRSLTACDGILAYERNGDVHLFDPATGRDTRLEITIAADLPHERPRYRRVNHHIKHADLSPTGARAVFEARGEILTVPAKKGDIRNLTRTPDAHERYPAWSPDGQRIAYFSDASGEYELVIVDQTGLKERETISPGDRTHYYSPIWSPDSKKIAYTDKALHLFYMDLEERQPIQVDTDTYDHPSRTLDPAWSPDSKWIAYTRRLDTHIRALFLYSLESGECHQVTDGLSDATSACFSRDGKYLFFAASSDYGLNTGWLDMSSYERPITSSLYVAVLSKEEPSPLAPESDEEPLANSDSASEAPKSDEKRDDKDKDKGAEPVSVRIDLDDLDRRIVPLPLPARQYGSLRSGIDKLFYLEAEPQEQIFRASGVYTLHTFDLKERKCEVFLDKVRGYWLSADGKKLLYQCESGHDFSIVDTEKRPDSEAAYSGALSLGRLEVYVDPRAEWRQMFDEVCRIQRDYFYDPHMHGIDWQAVSERYRPWLERIGSRDDLNYLFSEMMGELAAGHAYVGQGDIPAPPRVPCGLLGADYQVVEGHYRIARIYAGLNWHPELRAPLTEPGVNVSEGDYLLAVNGRPLDESANIYHLFEKTAGRITELLVGPSTDPAEARTERVVPIDNETGLRHWSWVEGNRQRVAEMTGGRVAYVYMPNTSAEGYAAFNRYYFSQLDKEAVVLDERFNGGGSVADYVIDMLDRPLLCHWATREGKVFHTPNASICGPKVMIINEYAGSGGDAMPLFFRRRGLGKLVGKRTWGGLIGIYDYPELMDGGRITAPRMAIFGPDNEWEVENVGVSPDIEVEQSPKLVIQGHDPQLEKAVEVVMAELAANPRPVVQRPAPANTAVV